MAMAPVMFDVPFAPGTPDAVEADFGTDLLAASDPMSWWQRRLDRCVGHWEGDDAAIIRGEAPSVVSTAKLN
jgi:hypothetical protein